MKLYNTMTRHKEAFVPREEGKVAMYVCGPTVYNHIHLGNARTFLSFDTIRRYLIWKGYDVTFVQNITDVDDKIIKRAGEEHRSYSQVAEEYTDSFIEAMNAMNVLPPTVRPRATETIDEMIDLIGRLIEGGHAYAVEGGDVYYRVRSFKEYGKLSGRSVDDMRSGARIEIDERKEDPLDFALWKAAKPGEPAWDSPWGKGRPGWHTECSAMSEEELGLPFDIHGGGVDLVFPHHENEIAQAEAATGKEFATYWMHGGMLRVNSEKMSKSLNNFFLLKDVLADYPASIIRLFMLQTHYRSPLDFSDARLEEARTAYQRMQTTVRNIEWLCSTNPSGAGAPEATRETLRKETAQAQEHFEESMDDDFNTAGALGAVFDIVRSANTFMSAHEKDACAEDACALQEAADAIVSLLDALGVELLEEESAGQTYPDTVVPLAHDVAGYAGNDAAEAVEALLNARAAARASKDWATADAVRDGLAALNFVIEDTPAGARVNYNG